MADCELPTIVQPSCEPARVSVEMLRDSPAQYALEARQVHFQRGRRPVLRGVDLQVMPAEMVALLGANGSGKTTLLHCLVGMLRPSAGEIRWCGEPVARRPALRRRVGFVGHESGLYLALTCWENLMLAGRLYGVDNVLERTREMLAVVGLERQAHERVACLSRGMRQRLAIARATIHRPDILVLDEPFTSLDAASRDWLTENLRELRDGGCGILFSTHDAAHARKLADRMLYLQAGSLQAADNIEAPAIHHATRGGSAS